MARTKTATVKKVAVRLSCIYSGDGESWGVGAVIEVDADEAQRLIGLGVAEVIEK